MCVYVIRYYGGAHLGNRRFEIARNVTVTALRNLVAVKAEHFRKRTHRLDSQNSTSEVGSAVGDDLLGELNGEMEMEQALAQQPPAAQIENSKTISFKTTEL